ncbi:MAG: FG-GAP-like repeat-containing protein [Bryobacteraceae bacterium]
MAHCNAQMSDFVAQPPPGLNGGVYVRSRDQWNFGVSNGDGCISNGTRVLCAYRQSWNALVVYDGDGNILWGTGGLLDNRSYSGLPIMQADGSVVAGDDQHIYYFNPDGSVAWVTTNPGGTPIGLVPTPNGAILTATDGQQLTQCWQANCTLAFLVNNGGTGYTSADVILAGGYCPGAAATATIANGAITAVTATTQGYDCDVIPDVIVVGNGSGASVSATLVGAAPVTVFSGTTGAVLSSNYLYQTGNSGPYYASTNTPCVNNGSYPNRLYILTNLQNDQTQGALWAVDVDPTNLASPMTPAWNVIIHGPSGASPLCVGNNVYFDGAGIVPGDNVGTTIFGVQDNGTSGSFLFQQALGPGTQMVTCNFALDPRPEGGFWHVIQWDPSIYHRDFNTGNLIESVNVSNLLVAQGAPSSTYWQAGVFTTYGTPSQPYLMLPEAAHPANLGYLAALNLSTLQLAWALPLAGNDPSQYDAPGGDAVLVLDSNQNPVIVMSGKQTGAYFITNGGPTAAVFPGSLSFGPQMAGTKSATQNFTLYDSASGVLTISGIKTSGPFSVTNNCGAGSVGLSIASIAASGAASQTNNCPTDLAPGATCTISVMLSAASTGTLSGTVTVTTNASGGPLTVSAGGSGLALPKTESALSTASLVFVPQTVGTVSPSQMVTLSNIGSLTLTIASILATGDAVETNTCGATLAAKTSCAITISFSPAAAGPRSGTVVVTDASLDSPHVVSISGVGLPNPVPVVNQPLLPTALQPGTSTPVVIVNGTGFMPGSVGYWNGTPRVTQYIGPAQLSVALTSSDVAAPGTGWVSVVNPTPGGGQSNVVWLPVGFASPAPVLNATSLPVGSAPSYVAVADLNNDGKLDLAVTNSGSATVSILLGNGDGTFAAHQDYATGNAPMAVAVGDFNHDGILDLVTANQTDNTVSILLGAGGGAFGSQTVYATGNQPGAVIVADLNGDGNLDLAVANQADNTVSILFGNGDGTFAAHLDYAAGEAPDALVAGDFNGDGKLDLAVANGVTPGGKVNILLNHGDGSYLPGVAYSTGDSVAVVIADFNGDGKLDFAAANSLSESLSVFVGNGDGTFTVGPNQSTRLSPSPEGLAVADVNADGTLELLMGGNASIGATALSNNSAATFSPLLQYGGVTGTTAIAVGDFNNDGSIDMALAVPASNSIAILMQSSAVVLSAGSLNFGNVQVGSTGIQTVTVTNSGSAMLQVPGITPSAAFSETDNCAGGIAPGNACTITVAFNPTATGSQNGTLTIANNAPAGSQTVGLSGVGSTFTVATGLSLSSVVGGNPLASNFVTLSSPAPTGGWTVNLSSSNPAIASVPATVTVAAGTSVSSAFTVTTAAVSTNVSVTITASVNGSAGAALLTVSPIGVAFTSNLPTIPAGTVGQDSLTLTSPAPANGLVFNLTSSNPSFASVPATVTVPAGATVSPNFNITTAPLATSTSATIFASLNGVNGSLAIATLKLQAAQVSSVVLTPSVIAGGTTTTGNIVNLQGLAPAGGLTVTLSSSNGTAAVVPTTVVVPANASSAPFTLTAGYVASSVQITITATTASTSVTAPLTINPDGVASLNLSSTTVVGGVAAAASNTATLMAPASSGGVSIKLSSSNPGVASVPSAVKVAAGATASAGFRITTTAVSVSTPVTLTATYNGVSVPVVLTVNPVEPAAVNLSQAGVVGGSKTINGSITMDTPAPTGGFVVSLTSSNPAVASVPATVTVAAGAKVSPKFTITTTAVTKQVPVTITATYQGNSATATLDVDK